MAYQAADKTAVSTAAGAASTALKTLEQALAAGLFAGTVTDADRQAVYAFLSFIQQVRSQGGVVLATI